MNPDLLLLLRGPGRATNVSDHELRGLLLQVTGLLTVLSARSEAPPRLAASPAAPAQRGRRCPGSHHGEAASVPEEL